MATRYHLLHSIYFPLYLHFRSISIAFNFLKMLFSCANICCVHKTKMWPHSVIIVIKITLFQLKNTEFHTHHSPKELTLLIASDMTAQLIHQINCMLQWTIICQCAQLFAKYLQDACQTFDIFVQTGQSKIKLTKQFTDV